MKYDMTSKSKENVQQLVDSFGGQKAKSQRTGHGKAIVIATGVALTLGLLWLLLHKKPTEVAPTNEPPDPKVEAGPLGMGDIDMDGWVSRWDYDLVEQIRFGQGDFTEEQLRRADINHDGVVSLSDWSAVMLIMTGHQTAE